MMKIKELFYPIELVIDNIMCLFLSKEEIQHSIPMKLYMLKFREFGLIIIDVIKK